MYTHLFIAYGYLLTYLNTLYIRTCLSSLSVVYNYRAIHSEFNIVKSYISLHHLGVCPRNNIAVVTIHYVNGQSSTKYLKAFYIYTLCNTYFLHLIIELFLLSVLKFGSDCVIGKLRRYNFGTLSLCKGGGILII